MGMWILVFGVAELYFNSSIRRKDQGYSKVAQKIPVEEMQLEKVGKRYTWESLDTAIMKGEMLVVANGKYVYDISKWITSHPGGQIILQNVNGTDITNDYFHEGGFDAAEFTPTAKPPPKKLINSDRRSISGLSLADAIAVERRNSGRISAVSIDASTPNFTQDEWALIQRARRTHVHTRLAIQKLASLVVGEIDVRAPFNPSFSATTINDFDSDQPFDEFEYRRYAMTKREIESPTTATKQFIRLKFCVLYPYESRAGQPKKFQPGQCIEIQARLPSGERISRFYTPISGNLNSFEIMVRVQPSGKMSNFLLRSEPGERQYKIRGPFGTPLLKDCFGPNRFYFDTIYFIGGGSGITPALQMMQYLFLSTDIKLQVFLFFNYR
jgi:hypothetical protein